MLTVTRNRAAAEFSSLEEEHRRLDAQEADEARRLTEAESRLADARVELAARRSSFEALSELERAREGYGAGVRAVFADDRRAALAGVIGTVAGPARSSSRDGARASRRCWANACSGSWSSASSTHELPSRTCASTRSGRRPSSRSSTCPRRTDADRTTTARAG